MRVLQIADGRERYVHNAIDIVIAFLHFRAENTDHFKAQSIQPDVFAHCIASREQFLFGLGPDHGHAAMLDLVFHIVETPLLEFQ